MDLWEKFFESGRIADYINYATHRKEDGVYADTERFDTQRE